ncbi:MAG: cytochrome P450 [Cyanomargarita calcarea GSE-NOS-MK-12-04C]|jgi:cytochrome P450|uniref:Cytochrome P450 n=1 Tax=Cyanomargarita calcarea GSE-NOS-MK-12-04C TaxID=2839659 RepID=A0A951URM6_9CYAN|nr:cytochrome P450 [Cyanomargarita calcarea GSE-NOS-MK-12-04C]
MKLEKQTPALLQTLQLIANPTQFFDSCAAKYGDTFTMRVLGFNSPPVVFFSHPEAISDCFVVPAIELDFQKATQVFKPLFGERSIVLQEGKLHNRQRQLLMPPFHGDRMKSYGENICQITQEITQNWQVDSVISISQVMPDITLQIILQVVFGINPGTRYEKLKKQLTSLLEDITKPWYSSLFFFPPLQKDFGAWSPWGNYLKRREEIDKLIYAEISERRLEKDDLRTDILSLLMSARDDNGQQMTDKELRDQLVSLLLLGYETTAGVLAWLFYLIHSHSTVKEKLREELDSLGECANPESIVQLPYLTAVCQETLRIHPIALICTPRMVKDKVEIAGDKYTSGTILVPSIYLAHRRAETYSEPDKFQPERFLNQKYTAYEYLPFGGGYRGCIGSAFSMYEMKLVLATILSDFKLELVGDRPVKPVRRGITIVPSGGVPMKVKVRS